MTPEVLSALDQYLITARGEAERIVKEQYMVGKHTVLDSVYPGVRGFMSDPEKLFANGLVRGNVDLITNLSKSYLNSVESMTRQAIEGSISPHNLITMFNKAELQFASSAKVVAFDQVAKAQELGRNTEYAQLGVKMVDVSIAPDACEICQGHVSEQPVSIDDTEHRPQFHIQCLCFDTPALNEAQAIRDACVASMEEKVSDLPYETKPADYRQVLCKMGADGGACESWNSEQNTDQLRKDLDGQYRSFADDAFNRQREAVAAYSDNYGYAMNDYLRMTKEERAATDWSKVIDGVSPDGQELKVWQTQVNNLIEKAPATEKDMTLFRSVNPETFNEWSRTIGTTVSDSGFTSTSISRESAQIFGNYVIEVQAPAGTQGMFLPAFQSAKMAALDRELEFLLGKGCSFKVIDVIGQVMRVALV